MRAVLLVVGGALVWCLLVGHITVGQFLLGLPLAWLTLRLSAPACEGGRFRVRPVALMRFLFLLLYDLCLSSLRVAMDALLPGSRSRPRILAVPVPVMDEVPLIVLANSVTLTPGSLTLDVEDGGRRIFIHDMYADDADQARAAVALQLLPRVQAAFPDRGRS